MSAPSPVAERPVLPARLERHLLVAWQHPSTRAYDLVGRLDIPIAPDDSYRFAYFRHAASVPGFRPFIDLPDLDRVYESHDLFPLFDNRLTPRSRADFPQVAAFVGLTADADPFEVLARTGGRRATDTVEVVPEPNVDPGSGRLEVDFLVHGVRHHQGLDACLDQLRPADRLRILWDVQNPNDGMAVALADGHTRNVGWIPRYLVPLVHRSAEQFGWSQVKVDVLHVGDAAGPPHLRLLCRLQTAWAPDAPVLDSPEYDLLEAPVAPALPA
jgi:hypothetical protein